MAGRGYSFPRRGRLLELLRERPLPVQIVLALVVPAAFGALAGWLLGVNEVAYLVVSVLAILGGYFAGREHMGAGEGALRGLVGGALFGGFILLVHEATGKEPKAELPDPEIIVLAITVVFGVVLGAMGGAATKRKAEAEDEEEDEGPAFDLKRIKRSEILGFVGAAVLAFAVLFLPWFSTSCLTQKEARAAESAEGGCNSNSKIVSATTNKAEYGEFTAWETYKITRYLLLAACIAPFLLAYIIARGHALSWRPGEVTMIVGMVAVALILLNGIILGSPGGSDAIAVDISLEFGYYIGLLGGLLICVGGFRRQAEDIQAKPPGI
jgi:hypothetical protein